MKTKSILLLLLIINLIVSAQTYTSDWESIDSRPVPEWFSGSKFGIFIHWGVYSVPSYRAVSKERYQTYAEWYEASVMHNTQTNGSEFHAKNFGKGFEYRQFAPMFRAELWDPAKWAKLFKQSGARYVVLTSKHHDGFCLFDANSPYSKNWNSVDTGPKRDILGELSEAVRKEGLKMGIYYSLMEWESTPRNHEWSGGLSGYYLSDSIINKYRIPDPLFINDHIYPQLQELVMKYEPAVIFSDGEWDKPDDYWRSTEFLAWLYNNSPNKNEVVVNDRWGRDTRGVHGGYYTSEYSSDQEKLSHEHPWEESRGMGESYGFNRAENIENYQTSSALIMELVSIVSRGGNLLLNIGPTADGRIPVIMQQRLIDIGEWLGVNGEAIYESEPWQNATLNPDYFFTQKGNEVYLIPKTWPEETIVIKGISKKPSGCTLLGSDIELKFKKQGNSIIINLPCVKPGEIKSNSISVIKISTVSE